MPSYDVVTTDRRGRERIRPYSSETTLAPGDVLRLDGRDWLVVEAEGERLRAAPARYRLELRHPDGRVEAGAIRRWRPDAPRTGHVFSTVENGQPAGWQVVDEAIAADDGGPYLELVAERDFDRAEPDAAHELEHAFETRDDGLPKEAADALAKALAEGLAAELVALDAGEAPDWAAAESYIDALVLEEIEDDLVEQCGVSTDSDPRDTWIDTVKERLQADLASFRADVEGEHLQILEWDFLDGRIFASVGTDADESDPASGHGWLCRLVDASALGAAGFERVRRPLA